MFNVNINHRMGSLANVGVNLTIPLEEYHTLSEEQKTPYIKACQTATDLDIKMAELVEEGTLDHISTDVGGRANHIKLWAHLLNKEITEAPEVVVKQTKSCSYTSAQIEDAKSDSFSSRNWNISRAKDVFTISVIEVKRGYELIDVFKAQVLADPNKALRHIPELTVHLTQDRNHKVDVYENVAGLGLVLVTNREPAETITTMLSACWSFLTCANIGEILRAKTLENSMFLQYCRALYRRDLTEYLAIVTKLVAMTAQDYANPAYIESLLKEFVTIEQKQKGHNLQKELDRLKRKISDYEGVISSLYMDARKTEIDVITLDTIGTQMSEQIVEAIKFVQSASNIVKLIKYDRETSSLVVDISVPIINYREKDVKMWYKHKDSSNHFTSNDIIKIALYKTFIDEEYELQTTTRIAIRLDNNQISGLADSYKSLGNSTGRNLRFGNTHITRYDCFSSAKAAIVKAMANQNYATVFAQLINACSTITFTDSAVISDLTSRLRNAEANNKLFKRKSDGAMFSILEVYEMHKDFDVFNPDKPAPAPTPNTADGIDMRAI